MTNSLVTTDRLTLGSGMTVEGAATPVMIEQIQTIQGLAATLGVILTVVEAALAAILEGIRAVEISNYSAVSGG